RRGEAQRPRSGRVRRSGANCLDHRPQQPTWRRLRGPAPHIPDRAQLTSQAVTAYGPSALGGGVRRFVELTLTLARTEFKLRYFGSVLGYFWSLMRPLLFFGVIYVFFTEIINVGKGIPHYGVYLLTGIVLWNFFS